MERLKVPENITTRWELWRGFGVKETAITAISSSIAIIIAVLYVMLKQDDPMAQVKAVIGVLLIIFVTISTVIKIENNQSILDYILRVIHYHREQQDYLYQSQEVIFVYEEEKE